MRQINHGILTTVM